KGGAEEQRQERHERHPGRPLDLLTHDAGEADQGGDQRDQQKNRCPHDTSPFRLTSGAGAVLEQFLELLAGLADALLAGADRGLLRAFQLEVLVRDQAAPQGLSATNELLPSALPLLESRTPHSA